MCNDYRLEVDIASIAEDFDDLKIKIKMPEGIWRAHPEVGEAFTMLTTEPGEDIAPYHKRQVIPLTRDQWADWLDPDVPAADVLRVLPKGSLPVTRVFPLEPAQAAML